MGKKRNILLDTINNSYDLGQVLSTYALYKTLEELGYDCVVNDRYLDEKSFGYQILKGTLLYGGWDEFKDDKGRILFNILCVYHRGIK